MASRTILLVEGKDDEHVLKHICNNSGISQLDEVCSFGGKKNLLESLPIRLKFAKEGDVIGVVIDADTDLDACWQAVRDRLVNVGYQEVSEKPDSSGTILEPPEETLLPRAGVWVMPNNRTPGILEDFLQFLIPRPNALFDHATACVESIATPLFKPKDKPRALIHTWLAWQGDPGKPYGTAIAARFLDPSVPHVDVLVSWLERLFIQQR